MPSSIFSASTFPPNERDEKDFKDRYSKILMVSREKYSKPRKLVEEKIGKVIEDIENSEQALEKKKEEIKAKKSIKQKEASGK
ncbi:MAG: hypothetical protein LBC61_04685, partial [Candidatus Peribacteria bacterium]|jgi:hypothetical protein|nr:hypothetical protein [Candidatus Peribacteria bacterium]